MSFAKKISLVICAFTTSLMAGQKPMQYMRAGDAAALEQKWDEAFSLYQQGYALDSTSYAMLYKYAEAARQVKYYKLAEMLYAKAFEKDNGKINPDGLYYLACMQKYNGRYEDAQRNLKKYLKKFKTTGNNILLERAEQEARSALWALNYKPPAEVNQAIALGAEINTEGSEINLVSKSNKYFVSSREEKNNGMWQMYYVDSISGLAKPMRVVGISTDSEVGSLSFFNENIYFSVKEDGVTKIYQGQCQGDKIFDVKEVKELNTDGTVNTMPVLSQIGEKTYYLFASNRESGHGGMDLWMALKEGDTVGKPKNMGNNINTPGDELTPFFDGDKLYFSSDWHEGFGGLDIFFCTQENGLVFSKPTNLGVPYNSSANDFYYSKNDSDTEAYFSSNRDNGDNKDNNETCCSDLYLVKLPQAKRETEPEDESQMDLRSLMKTLPVVLYFHNDEPNPDVWDTTTTLTYTEAYNSYMQMQPVYIKENTKNLVGEKREESEQITNDFFEFKVKKGKSDLEVFTDMLLAELQKGQSLKIQVRGFASPRAKSDYNLNLTKRRTSSLVNYMRTARNGAFLPYISDTAANGARLEFELIPFGEVKADKSVSDDLVDEKNSIYVRSACLERKIEIEKVVHIENTVRYVKPAITKTEHDFGKINHSEPVSHTFQIGNDGNMPMYIDSIIASCGCTNPKITKSVILPGEIAELEIGFNPFGKKAGVDIETATIYIRGREPLVITIKADVQK